MQERTTRGLGVAALFGAMLSVLVALPGTWYGLPQSDAYVFTPDPFAPLWIHRTLVPFLGVLAITLVLAGVYGLYRRDEPALDGGGTVAVIGIVLLDVCALNIALFEDPSTTGDGNVYSMLVYLLSKWAAYPSALVLLVGLFVTGVVYLGADHRSLAIPLVAGSVLTTVAGIGVYLQPTGELLPVAVWFAMTAAAIGIDLWRHPEPVLGKDESGPADTQ